MAQLTEYRIELATRVWPGPASPGTMYAAGRGLFYVNTCIGLGRPPIIIAEGEKGKWDATWAAARGNVEPHSDERKAPRGGFATKPCFRIRLKESPQTARPERWSQLPVLKPLRLRSCKPHSRPPSTSVASLLNLG